MIKSNKLFDSLPNFGFFMNLIDVIELSKKICEAPIQAELAYATPRNLVGRPLNGYHTNALDICLLTPKAAEALCHVQNEITKHHQMGLFVYDTYRPRIGSIL